MPSLGSIQFALLGLLVFFGKGTGTTENRSLRGSAVLRATQMPQPTLHWHPAGHLCVVNPLLACLVGANCFNLFINLELLAAVGDE